MSNFQKTGIYFFNSEPFIDDDCLMFSVIDRLFLLQLKKITASKEYNKSQEAITSRPVSVTSEQIRPFSKAKGRKRKEGTRVEERAKIES